VAILIDLVEFQMLTHGGMCQEGDIVTIARETKGFDLLSSTLNSRSDPRIYIDAPCKWVVLPVMWI
jgi:hypothetical protein